MTTRGLALTTHPRSASAAPKKRPKFRADGPFRRDLDARVDEYFTSTQRSRHGDWRMYTKTAVMFAWLVGSYLMLLLVASTWWQGILGTASLAFAIAGVGFCVQHDANHGAYSKSRTVNRILERTLDVLGASSYIWRWKHNVFHHTYTNVSGADNDIQLAPFARLAPSQRRRSMHRFQHLYMWVLYGFTVFHMHFVEDFVNVIRGRVGHHKFPRPRGLRMVEVFASKLFVFGWGIGIPMFFHSWWVVLAFYAGLWFAVGLILGLVFQVAHCLDDSTFPVPNDGGRLIDDEWSAHQVRTTTNFSPGGWLTTWYVGGLNYQIEHHLFPRICHIHYPRLSAIVREVCGEHGIRYECKRSFWSALASHARLLRRMGRPEPAQG